MGEARLDHLTSRKFRCALFALSWAVLTAASACSGDGAPGGRVVPDAGAELPADAAAVDAALLDATAADAPTSTPSDADVDDTGVIDADTSSNVDAGTPDTGEPRYHPEGYADPATHGADLRAVIEDCRTCHGSTLSGGSAPSCDGCHQAGWRTNCTYCHGGTNDTTGAPPRDLDGETTRDLLRFRAHTEHVRGTAHPAYDCTQCHTKPTDVTSAEHVFDATPGHAEVTFAGGLSAAGRYLGNGSCENLYCHGDGRASGAGAYEDTRAAPDCNGCHPGPTASSTAQTTMSGEHRRHLRANVRCGECHASTVDMNDAISTPANHANGTREVAFTAARFSRSTSGRCTGLCHELHVARSW